MSAAATIPIVDDDPTRRGVHGFITKPYDQDAPLDEVRKALVERSLNRASEDLASFDEARAVEIFASDLTAGSALKFVLLTG